MFFQRKGRVSMENFSIFDETPLFRGIDPAERDDLLRTSGGGRRTYRKGDLLLRAGERNAQMGLVLSGTLHILREDFWGGRTIVGLAEPGEVFAESFALANEPLEVTVLAMQDTTVLFLDAGRACAHSPQFAANLLTMLAGKNLSLTRKMGFMARKTTREKLLSYLSAQAMRVGKAEFDIPLDRQQLADFLAVDRSAMSAVLGKLRQEGVLTVQKNHFHLLHNPEQTFETI